MTALVSATDVRAVVDRNAVTLNDVFNLQIIVDDGGETPEVDISPVLENFSVVSGPSQHTSMNWINGKMSSTLKVSWSLVPRKTGNLEIPSLEVRLGNAILKTEAIVMKVTRTARNESEGEDLFIRVDIDRDEAYLGQQITVSYKLYTRVNMTIQDLQLPEFRGFWSEELYLPKQIEFRDATLKGVSYKVASLYKVAIFPTALGHVTLPPLTLKTQVETRRKQRTRRSIFDDPFFNTLDPFGRQMVPRLLRSEDVNLHIINYPGEIPDKFDNAVGEFEIKAELDSSVLKVNEAATLRLTLSGTGNLNLITLPEPNFPGELEVFPPTTSVEKDPFRDQITGMSIWEYILIPRSAGQMIIPSIDLVVFEPKNKSWNHLITRPIQLTVIPGDENISSPGHTREEIQLLGSDIRYIHTETPDWDYVDYFRKKVFITGFYLLAFILLALPRVVTQVRDSRANSFLSRRADKAARVAHRKLRAIKGDPYSSLSKTMYQFLRDRFYLKSEKLDPYQVGVDLKERIPEDDLRSLVLFLKKCDAGRYAPGEVSSGEDPVKIAGEIIKRIKKYG